jgi:hypothetical protein
MNIAVRLVQDDYPAAKLLEGDGIPPAARRRTRRT